MYWLFKDTVKLKDSSLPLHLQTVLKQRVGEFPESFFGFFGFFSVSPRFQEAFERQLLHYLVDFLVWIPKLFNLLLQAVLSKQICVFTYLKSFRLLKEGAYALYYHRIHISLNRIEKNLKILPNFFLLDCGNFIPGMQGLNNLLIRRLELLKVCHVCFKISLRYHMQHHSAPPINTWIWIVMRYFNHELKRAFFIF